MDRTKKIIFYVGFVVMAEVVYGHGAVTDMKYGLALLLHNYANPELKARHKIMGTLGHVGTKTGCDVICRE